MLLILILGYFLVHTVLLKANEDFNLHLEYGENGSVILFYNLTTNYSYFLTFRSFGNDQFKSDLYPPAREFKDESIEISYQDHPTEFFYLFITCFHFILSSNDLDIQCKDLRLFPQNTNKSSEEDFLPSYNPLFVPMMYALSIVMLLPVIIQHHRRKKAQELQRAKELRRLSVSISQDKQNPKRNFAQKLLSQMIENGNINYKNIPMDIELVSPLSTIDDNIPMTFTLDNLQPLIHRVSGIEEESSGVDAHDCIAHLLDNTPWNTPSQSDQPLSTSFARYSVVQDSASTIKRSDVPTIVSIHDDNDDDDDRKPILRTKKSSLSVLYRTNRTFFESDV